MRQRFFLSAFVIVLLATVAGFFAAPSAVSGLPSWFFKPYRLGLDLQGGAHLVYEANMASVNNEDRASALEGVRDVIERRVNAFGVSEPLVQTTTSGDHYRIIVELAGIKDLVGAKKQIGETPILEFKEENPQPQRDLNPEEQKQMTAFNIDAKKKAERALVRAIRGADFENLIKEFSDTTAEAAISPVTVTTDSGAPVQITQVGSGSPSEALAKEGDLGFVKKGSEYQVFIEAIEKAKLIVPAVLPTVIETSDGFNVVRLAEARSTEIEVQARHILICYKGAEKCEQETSKEEARKKIDELKLKATPENFETLVKENSTEPGAAGRGGDLGWFGKGAMVKPFEDTVFPQAKGTISNVVETAFGFHIIYKIDERALPEYHLQRILVKTKKPSDYAPYEPWKYTGLTGKQLASARVQFDPNSGRPEIGLKFNSEGATLFGEITTRNVGKPVAIFLDKEPISIPRVQGAITGGEAVITGTFSLNEAKLLAQRLNAGALPVPVTLAAEQVVEASLGKDSLTKSLWAGLYGVLLVALFMVLYYRVPGFIAVLSLVVYGVFLLAIFKLLGITLTLAGIAGVIIAFGMAVDANVLTFERLKEELKSGASLGNAIPRAFARSWLAVRDSQLTTILMCVILITFATSLVQGFGFTLFFGTLMSMITGMVVTKVLLSLTARFCTALWWYGVNRNI